MQQQGGGGGAMDELLSLGMLALGIAHDLDNVLLGIGGCLECARLPSLPPDSVQRSLAEAASATDRGRALTRELFELARRTHAPDAECRLDEAVRRHEPTLQRMLPPGLELALHLDAGDARVATSPGRLDRALSNLCRNAVQAMPNGGHVRISTRVVEAAGDEPNPKGHSTPPLRVQLTVEDTGKGMDDATRTRALEPFFTTRAASGGTGLGLPTVACIARLAGGDVTIESAVGRGTRVRLDLPARRPR